MTTLAEYLKERKESENAFALRAGISQPTIWRIIRGEVQASPETAMKIEVATDGEISALSILYPESLRSKNN